MSKRKYRVLVDITLLVLCLFPIILVAINSATSNTLLTNAQICSIINGVNISNTMSTSVHNALTSAHIDLDGNIGACVSGIISNAIMIHIVYLFIEIMCFIPKFAIKAMNAFTGGND